VTLTATDTDNQTAAQIVTVDIRALPTEAPPSASYQLDTGFAGLTTTPPTLTDGTGPFTWSTGTLPAGMSVDAATGVISGTPTTPGTTDLTLTATDSDGQSATQAVTVTVVGDPGLAPSSSTVGGDVGYSGFGYSPAAPTGGTGAYVWTS